MIVKNVSARLHHVGSVSIAPGETKDIPDEFAGAFNAAELVAVDTPAPVKRGRPAKTVDAVEDEASTGE